MNGRERFLAALRREEPDRVPIWELIVNEPTRSARGANSLEEFVLQEDLDAITIFEEITLRDLAERVTDPGPGSSKRDHHESSSWRGIHSGLQQLDSSFGQAGQLQADDRYSP